MEYTNNVPQANQQFATTQPLIENNFAFLQTGIGTEHNFNPTGNGSDMYHLQASMPDEADPVAVPTNTNGVYYVNGGLPKFFNTANGAQFLAVSPIAPTVLSGTVTLSTTSANVATLPANSVGNYYLRRASGATDAYAVGQFVTGTSTLAIGEVSDPSIDLGSSGLTFTAKTNTSSVNGSYNYLFVFWTT